MTNRLHTSSPSTQQWAAATADAAAQQETAHPGVAATDAPSPHLPLFALQSVAGNLTLQDLVRMRQASRHFRNAQATPAQIAQFPQGVRDREQLKLALDAHPGVTELTLSTDYAISAAHFEALSRNASLRKLVIRNAVELHGEALRPLRGMTALTHLKLSNCLALQARDLRHCTPLAQLTSLTLNSACELTGEHDELAPLNDLRCLRSLDLSLGVFLRQEALAPLTGLHQLSTLDLSGNANFTDAPALRNFRQLERLDLSWQERLNDQAIGAIVASNAPLRHLTLRKCNALTDAGFATLRQLTHLESLDLSYCGGLGAHGLDFAYAMPNLKVLDLSNCYNHDLGPFHIEALSLARPDLQVKVQ